MSNDNKENHVPSSQIEPSQLQVIEGYLVSIRAAVWLTAIGVLALVVTQVV
jgi:hypothetical protein